MLSPAQQQNKAKEEKKNQQHDARKKITLPTGWVRIFVEAKNELQGKKKPLHYYII